MNILSTCWKNTVATLKRLFRKRVKTSPGSIATASRLATYEEIRNLHPIRAGDAIYIKSGEELLQISPMTANLLAQAWTKEVGAAYVARCNS